MQVPPRQGFEFAAAKLWSQVPRRATLLMLLVVGLAVTAQPGCQAAAAVTLVKAGRLLDPRSGQVLAPAAVVVEGEKIKEVGSFSHIGGQVVRNELVSH